MVTLITVIHVIAAIFLILVVLLQSGKGASMGASFGGASQTVFGASGAGGFLTKLTAASAIIFMCTSLTLAYMSSRSESTLERAMKGKAKVSDQKTPTVVPEGQSVPPADQAKPADQKASPDKPADEPAKGGDAKAPAPEAGKAAGGQPPAGQQ